MSAKTLGDELHEEQASEMSEKQKRPYYDPALSDARKRDNVLLLIEDLKDSLFGKCRIIKPSDAAMDAAMDAARQFKQAEKNDH